MNRPLVCLVVPLLSIASPAVAYKTIVVRGERICADPSDPATTMVTLSSDGEHLKWNQYRVSWAEFERYVAEAGHDAGFKVAFEIRPATKHDRVLRRAELVLARHEYSVRPCHFLGIP